MRSVFRLSSLLIILALATACVKQSDLLILEKKISDQEQELMMLKQQQGKTKKEVEEVRPGQADLWSEVQGMRVKLAELEGRVEDMQDTSDALAETTPQLRLEMERLHNATQNIDAGLRQVASEMDIQLELYKPKPQPIVLANATIPTTNGTMPMATNATMPVDNEVAPTTKPAKEEVKAEEQPVDTAQALYDAAITAFKDRRYKDAQRMWEQFEKTYPKHKLVPNAIFWQGEAYYQSQDYARAVLAYQRVIDKHKKSSKYLSAQLKQGSSFMRLGKKKAGSYVLNQLIKKHPKSGEAKRAEKVLKKYK